MSSCCAFGWFSRFKSSCRDCRKGAPHCQKGGMGCGEEKVTVSGKIRWMAVDIVRRCLAARPFISADCSCKGHQVYICHAVLIRPLVMSTNLPLCYMPCPHEPHTRGGNGRDAASNCGSATFSMRRLATIGSTALSEGCQIRSSSLSSASDPPPATTLPQGQLSVPGQTSLRANLQQTVSYLSLQEYWQDSGDCQSCHLD